MSDEFSFDTCSCKCSFTFYEIYYVQNTSDCEFKIFPLIKLFSHFESTVTFVLMKVNAMLSDFQC